jgi:hypothetical protein
MPSGSPHSPRRSRRTALRLLATLLLTLALAEPAAAESFGVEEIQDAAAEEAAAIVAEAGGAAAAEVTVPEVSVEVADTAGGVAVANPAEAAPVADAPEPVDLANSAGGVDASGSLEAVNVSDPVEAVEAPEPVEPVETPDAAVREAADGRPALLGAGDRQPAGEPAAELAAMASDLATRVEEAKAPLPDLDLHGLGPSNGTGVSEWVEIPQLFGRPGRLGVSALAAELSRDCGDALSQSNLTWDGACLPLNLRGNWPGGDRPRVDGLGGLLEALLPEGMGLGEAVGGLQIPAPAPTNLGARPRVEDAEDGRSAGGSRTDGGALAAPPTDRAGPAGFSLAAEAARAPALMGDRAPAAAPARRGAGRSEPARDPTEGPQPLALAAGGAPAAGGGGGGGASFLLFVAALVGALRLAPPPPGGRVRAVGRRLSSLLSSSRLERPG